MDHANLAHIDDRHLPNPVLSRPVDGTLLVELHAEMTPSPSSTLETIQSIGKLCAGGDWACAHGDFSGLRNVARQLEDYVAEPLHCQLVDLADACVSDPERASMLWDRVKGILYRTAS